MEHAIGLNSTDELVVVRRAEAANAGRDRTAGTMAAGRHRTDMGHEKRPERRQHEKKIPSPGPYADPKLTDPEKTPGSGVLPGPEDPNPSPTG
jgi:hypothetical protein